MADVSTAIATATATPTADDVAVPSPRWVVLSDMDGTLLDTERTWLRVIEEFSVDHGIRIEPALVHALEGVDLRGAADVLCASLSLDTPADAVAAELDRRSLEAYAETVSWRPGAPALLQSLVRAQVPLALVTSSPRHWVERFASAVDLSMFSVVVTADDTPRTKPAPDPYLRAAAALGIAADRCVALEDSVVGATSAVAAGCATVVVGDPARTLPPGVHRVGSLREVDLPMLRGLARHAPSS